MRWCAGFSRPKAKLFGHVGVQASAAEKANDSSIWHFVRMVFDAPPNCLPSSMIDKDVSVTVCKWKRPTDLLRACRFNQPLASFDDRSPCANEGVQLSKSAIRTRTQ